MLERVPYSEHPPRFDYRLTDKGRDLWPVLTAMRQWGDAYAAPAGPPVQVVHTGCGHHAGAVMVCASCGEPLNHRNVRAFAAPGHEQAPRGRRVAEQHVR